MKSHNLTLQEAALRMPGHQDKTHEAETLLAEAIEHGNLPASIQRWATEQWQGGRLPGNLNPLTTTIREADLNAWLEKQFATGSQAKVPIGLHVEGYRLEHDSMGFVEVPANHYWGSQTQRSLHHFSIGKELMPLEVYRAYGYVKKAAASVNAKAALLPRWKADTIMDVCDEIIRGELDAEFPLYVWQTGSGTHSNMNVNEVIANRCIQLVGGTLGSQTPFHPNDDVNMNQSSNDTFPTAMHLASYHMVHTQTIPELVALHAIIANKSAQWRDVVKIGRTHLQDATPITVGQEWSGYASALGDATEALRQANEQLLQLAIGGTAVGTGINAPPNFGRDVCRELASLTGYPYEEADNHFAAQATQDRMARAHSALKSVAVTLYKIANDFRWLGSGPRCGLMELKLPDNEPGSSIMPGKVNPTQAEALLMVCMQVMGNDVAVQMAAAEGNFELNAFRPVVISNFLGSARILADACLSFRKHLVTDTQINADTLRRNVADAVMLVTALVPHIGYDLCARIAHEAITQERSLRDVALEMGVEADLFEQVVNPLKLARPGDL